MQEKFLNDSIIGNKNMVASYNKKGELLRLFYPNTDYRQFVDFFRTGLKINDSALIYLHEDANNTYQQYYTENTNILNTEINNTYFHLRTLQTDFASTNENILVKRYTFINENTIDLTVKFLIHSSLLTDDNNMMSCIIKNDCMTQYCHDYLFHTFSPASRYFLLQAFYHLFRINTTTKYLIFAKISHRYPLLNINIKNKPEVYL